MANGIEKFLGGNINDKDYPTEREYQDLPYWVRANLPSREYMNKRQRKRNSMKAANNT